MSEPPPSRSTKFSFGTGFTAATQVLNMLFGIIASIILARSLGPEGKGTYALASLLPSIIVTFGNMGIGPATVYHVARAQFRRKEVLGNNVLLSLGIAVVGVVTALVVVLFFRQYLFRDVAPGYLFLAMALIPLEVLYVSVRHVLLGAQRLREYNYTQVVHSAAFLGFVAVALLGCGAGVTGVLIAALLTWSLVNILALYWARKTTGGIQLRINISYMRQAVTYGLQAHVSNILAFLNYRIDMFLINAFLGPTAAGLYSAGVGLVEKLWLISHAASTVLFPRVAAGKEVEERDWFTPLVARTVLWMTALGALVLGSISRWLVLLLYSEAFLPGVRALQVLLIGIAALSAGRVLANDIAGRGRPILNTYTGVAVVATNVALNIMWIPGYGISGAAWASTVSYSLSLLSAVVLYSHLSGNKWSTVLLPQRSDWEIYRRTALSLGQWAQARARRLW